MIFLTKEDLRLQANSELINQVISENYAILDIVELYALERVKELLGFRYDMNYELRGYLPYQTFTDYEDTQRLLLTYNSEHNQFGTNFNLKLIDYNIQKCTETIISKTINECPPEYIYCPVASFVEGQEKYTKNPNPKWNPSCGNVYGTNGIILSTHKPINFYNTIYHESGTNFYIDKINYSNIDPNLFYGNEEYFDQYLFKNYKRDFCKDDRNISLIVHVSNIFFYELFRRTAARQLSETVKSRYEETLAYLVSASNGDVQMQLKRYPAEKQFQNNMPVRFGYSKVSLRYKT